MKSFVRWSATLGVVGSALIGSSFMGNMQALALPQEQVVKKLQTVPVFAIADQNGAPLVATVKNPQTNKDTPVAGVFLSQRDAQGFIDKLKKENPNLGKTVRVLPMSLGEVYKIEESNQSKPDALNFAFVPMQQQVDTAMTLLRQGGQQVQQFNGVPMFVAKAGKEKGYLTIQENNQQVIPFFFDKEQLQGMVDSFKKQKPDLASTVEIQVVNLQGVIQALRSSNNAQLNNIVLVPSQESLQFLRTLQPSSSTNKPQQAPRR
jgi:nickel transport protein